MEEGRIKQSRRAREPCSDSPSPPHQNSAPKKTKNDMYNEVVVKPC